MTETVGYSLKTRWGKGRVAVVFFAVIFTAYAIVIPDVIFGAATEAARRFALNALSSVLLFTTASSMLVKSGFGEVCKKVTGRVFLRFFGLNGGFAAPFIIGAVSGYPLGVKTVCELYRRGECGKWEAESAMAFCSVPGLGFTIAFVGGVLWGDIRFGICAWVSCLMGAVAVGVLGGRWLKRRGCSDGTHVVIGDGAEGGDFSAVAVIIESVWDAAVTALRVFAFVVFFNAVAAVLWGFTAWFGVLDGGATAFIKAVTVSFFEFSSGVSRIADCALPSVCFFSRFYIDGAVVLRGLTVAVLAWSGVSVHMQSHGYIASCGLSARRYYIGKAASVLLSVFFYALTVCVAS